MFEKISKWYSQGLWSAEMVLDAVSKGVLTAAQAAQIFGEAIKNETDQDH